MADILKSWLEQSAVNTITNSDLDAHLDSRVCVVTMFGKSPYGVRCQVADLLNSYLDRDIFDLPEHLKEKRKDEQTDKSTNVKDAIINDDSFEVYFDEETQTIFIYVRTTLETNEAVACLKSFDPNEEAFLQYWSKAESAFARKLLFVFSISHIILIAHPVASFDVTYVRLFRQLDAIRLRLLPAVSDALRAIPFGMDSRNPVVSKVWMSNGRPCSPRVLFCFRRPTTRGEVIDPRKRDPFVRLEQSLENQIYKVLRKSRIITNTSINSLFAVPANMPYCFVMPPAEEPVDMKAYISEQLHKFCSDSGYNSDVNASSADDVSPRRSFFDFLTPHIDLAHDKGFDDNSGRNPALPIFELPRLKNFLKIANALYPLFLSSATSGSTGRIVAGAFEQLTDLLSPELKFSQSRCNKYYSVALSAYEDGLLPFYTKAQHEAKLSQALQLLQAHARGPALAETLTRLREACEHHWKDGHQSCECVSLTGSNCVVKVHITPEEASTSANPNELPILKHTSRVRFLSTCNCGQRQAMRDDPFDVREANCNFYKSDEFICCQLLEKIEFPCYVPASPLSDAAAGESGDLAAAVRRRTISVAGLQQQQQQSGAREDLQMEKLQIRSQDDDDELRMTDEHLDQRDTDFLLDRDNRAQPLFADDARGIAASLRLQEQAASSAASDAEPRSLGGLENQSPLATKKLFGKSSSNLGIAQLSSAAATPVEETASDVRQRHASASAAIKTQQSEPDAGVSMGSHRGSSTMLSDLLQDDGYFANQPASSAMESDAPLEKQKGESTTTEGRLSAAELENSVSLSRPVSASPDSRQLSRKQSNASSMEPAAADQEQDYGMVKSQDQADDGDEFNAKLIDGAAAVSTGDDAVLQKEKHKEQELIQDQACASLPLMVTNHTPPGVLPQFSSWSLICLGHSSVYAHAQGLRDMPNFSHGSGYLLPWDAHLKADLSWWQHHMEQMLQTSKRGTGMRKPISQKATKNEAMVSVKLFVGFEYECPRGHRFMMQSPDKVLKHVGSGGPKEHCDSLMKSDMPLWFPCGCRVTKPTLLGQLMRIHIVTPKAPVVVTILPKIQPDPKRLTLFLTGVAQPIVLEPAFYYVMRLPFVYVDDEGPCYPPKETMTFGRLLKGCISVFPDTRRQ